MSNESMVSAEHYRELQHEADALKSHVYRLRKSGEQAVNAFALHGLGDLEECDELYRVLKEHPEQSLAAIQAAELRRVLALKNNGTYPGLRDVVAGEAYQREREAQQ